MSRKHYIEIAKVLNRERPPAANITAVESWRTIRDALADLFYADNPSFDRGRFKAATEKEATA